VEAGQPHVLDELPGGGCFYCTPIANWQAAMVERIMNGLDVDRRFILLMPRQQGLSGLLDLIGDSGPVEVVVPVVPIEDGDTTGADQEADDDERDAEPQLTANDHDDAGDHQDDGD
jgi:hypothetical protein